MKNRSPLLTLLLALCLIFPSFSLTAHADTADVGLTILFTHDTHDHFLPDAADEGGYVRLATLLKEQRNTPTVLADGTSRTYPVVTLDAGDFSMGSLFQTAYTSTAPELRALGKMGYDVTTLGNHEFDYRPQGFADMLHAAKESGDPLPVIVQANYKTPADGNAQVAADAMQDFPIPDYTVLERDGLKIAVFGLMGLDSHECAPMSGMVYEPIIDTAKRVVEEIQQKEAPDFILCLSHSGTENGSGEDYELAEAVDGIDLIISGHTHTTLSEPICVNNTLIASCGPYTKNLGRITIHKSGSDLSFSEYKLLPVDNSVAADAEMTAFAQECKQAVEQSYLSLYNLGYDEVLTQSSTDFTIAETGDLIGNAYISTIKKVEGNSYTPIAFAVAPNGVIRAHIRAGNITTANAFDILSLGSGSDGSPGYPLVSVYLTGKDLKNAFEVDASVSRLMSAAELFGAGCRWGYNPHRMFLDRVTGFYIQDENSDTKHYEILDDQLYRVVADLYSGQMLGTVESKSFGLLTVTPRDENGNPVTDLESRILHDSEGNEVKAWYALASYLKEQDELTPPPSSKSISDSRAITELLFPMGLPTLLVLLAGILLILLAGIIIYRVLTRKRRKNKQGYRPYRG